MTDRQLKSAKELFLAAVGLPLQEREVFLVDECGTNGELRAAVDRLLGAHARPVSLLDSRRPGSDLPSRVAVCAGTLVGGRYKLLELIGEGGMGEVWMAAQSDPVQRLVAVKLIKPGMDSRQVVARFEAERQALALMDHPNIARVFDAGATDDGLPFFVMELVKGVPITEFCDTNRLTPRERLELFVHVCDGVQHAHQKGVIHRDLKPGNVLVSQYDSRLVPKIIDFGVAKAIEQPMTEKTLVTAFGVVIGTPAYMSPEQATFNSLDVDTRTDVFALGVVLYELLTGTTPFDRKVLERDGLLEALRVIREQEPLWPSSKLSTAEGLPAIAASRGTVPEHLTSFVQGELDWIVMKALDKERARRYPTADELGRDVARFLAGEPVLAVPPSVAYQLRKFAERHQVVVLAAALVLLSLVAGTVAATIGLVHAESSRQSAVQELQRAERAREASDAMAGLLLYDILQQADVRRQAEWKDVVDPDLTIREALDRASDRIDARTGLSKRAEGVVRWAIGDAYVGLGQPMKAIPHLEKAWQLHVAEPEFGAGHGETIFGMHKLSAAYRSAGLPEKARALSEQAVPLAMARSERDPSDTQGPLVAMNDLALALRDCGQFAEAVAQFEQAEKWATSRFSADHEELKPIRANLADAYRAAGRLADAEKVLQNLLAAEKADGDEIFTARLQSSLARTYADLKQWMMAEGLLRESLAIRRRREPKIWTTFDAVSELGEVLLRQKEWAQAEPLLLEGYREMKAREVSIPPQSRKALGAAAARLAEFYSLRNNPEEAAKWREEQKRYSPVRSKSSE